VSQLTLAKQVIETRRESSMRLIVRVLGEKGKAIYNTLFIKQLCGKTNLFILFHLIFNIC